MRHLNHVSTDDHKEEFVTPNLRDWFRSEFAFLKLGFKRQPQAYICSALVPVLLILVVILNSHS